MVRPRRFPLFLHRFRLFPCRCRRPFPLPPSRKALRQRLDRLSRLRPSRSNGLTEPQQRHLSAFIDKYVKKTPESKRQTQAHRAHLADPRAVAGFKNYWKEMVYPLVAERTAGATLWDADGNQYVDVTMGFGTNLFGHSPAFITEALQKQLSAGH